MPTSTSCTVTPIISPSGGRVTGQVHISNSTITTNSIYWKSQQSTTSTLVMGLIVSGRRPISTSPLNINYCSLAARGRVAGLLWPRSTSINISYIITIWRVGGHTWPTSTTSAIPWFKVAALLRPMNRTIMTSKISRGTLDFLKRPVSTSFLTKIHFKNFFFRTFVIVDTTAGGRMAGPTRPIS